MAKQKQDDQLEHTYIQQLCEDTGCSPGELPEAMNAREKWRERGSGISVLVARLDDDDDIVKNMLTENPHLKELKYKILKTKPSQNLAP